MSLNLVYIILVDKPTRQVVFFRYEFKTAHARDGIEMIVKKYPRSPDTVKMF